MRPASRCASGTPRVAAGSLQDLVRDPGQRPADLGRFEDRSAALCPGAADNGIAGNGIAGNGIAVFVLSRVHE
jgi:hypothetical protein